MMASDRAQTACSADRGVWRGGWHALAFQQQSPNHGPRPHRACIDLVVVHSISLPPGEFGTGFVHALFGNVLDWDAHPYFQAIRGLRVSSHFFIARNGSLWQFVDCDARAWHAGISNYRGRDNCNDDSIGIELEGMEGDRFTPAQYDRLETLIGQLRQRYPVRYIAGHEHIAPGRKRDPGSGFDWDRLQTSPTLRGLNFPTR